MSIGMRSVIFAKLRVISRQIVIGLLDIHQITKAGRKRVLQQIVLP